MYKLDRDYLKYSLFENAAFSSDYGMPIIEATQTVPLKLVSFNECFKIEHPEEYFVHFYIDDYQFERIWNKPKRYVEILRKFAGVISPDFSLYLDMPRPQQIWNDYRNKLLGYFCNRVKSLLSQTCLGVIPKVLIFVLTGYRPKV